MTTPRAVRPVNARVSAVGAPEASASRCAGDVPASGVRISAVPSCAAARAGGEHRGDRAARRQAAGGDQRQLDLGADQLQGGEQAELGAGLVVEAAAVAAGLHALDDERVRARVAREARLGRRRHGDPRLRPDAMEPPTITRGRAAEREGDDRRPLLGARASLSSQPSSSRRGSPSATPARSLSARSFAA